MTHGPLAETRFLDFNSPEVAAFVKRGTAASGGDKRKQAVDLFYAVRDGLFYEIYNADFSLEAMSASAILRRRSGLCIQKSIVYAAALRRVGIPSRLAFMDVKNHLCSDRLRNLMGGNTFHYHCLVSLKLDGRFIRATPVFNRRLCELYNVAPLEFDGAHDCVHHPFDKEGRRYMEIVRDHGEFDDLPYRMVLDGLREKHQRLFATKTRFRAGSLVRDVRLSADAVGIVRSARRQDTDSLALPTNE